MKVTFEIDDNDYGEQGKLIMYQRAPETYLLACELYKTCKMIRKMPEDQRITYDKFLDYLIEEIKSLYIPAIIDYEETQ